MDSLILHKGQVTHVLDPSSFWMRIGTDADFQEFQEYQNTLNKFYNEIGRQDSVSADTLTQGQCVMVAHPDQEQMTINSDDKSAEHFQWNRAQVFRMHDDRADVFYIDLGYTEIVHTANIKNITQELFDYLPSQVIQLRLAGIKPITQSWTSRTVDMFKSIVVDQEILVSLVDYDEVNKYGQVVLYRRDENGSWRCLTHVMLDEDLGLPVEPLPEEFLSQEIILAALARGEQDLSLSCGEDVLHGSENQEHFFVPENGQVSSWKPAEDPVPDGLTAPMESEQTNSACENAVAEVPAFDLRSLGHTKCLSLLKMQEDKVEEQRLLTRAKLEQELINSEEEQRDDDSENEWGKSDLQIGKVEVFSDFDSIRQEIYRLNPDQYSKGDLHGLFHAPGVTGIHYQKPLAKFTATEEQGQNVDSHRGGKVNLMPLTERENYEIQKKVEEILSGSDSGEADMVRVLINSIIEPDVSVPGDRLVAVFTAVLEAVVRNCDIDPLIALGVLETYLGAASFDMALESTLKSLRSFFVKISKAPRHSNYHRTFTEALATLFIRARNNWTSSSCSLIEEFVMVSLERWVIFNKQKMSSSDNATGLEQLYLECADILVDSVWTMLNNRFPDRCSSVFGEIKHKLLHESTHRIIRQQLLDLLLKLHTQICVGTSSSPAVADKGIQTEITISFTNTGDKDSARRYTCAEGMKTEEMLALMSHRFQSVTDTNTLDSGPDEDRPVEMLPLYPEDSHQELVSSLQQQLNSSGNGSKTAAGGSPCLGPSAYEASDCGVQTADDRKMFPRSPPGQPLDLQECSFQDASTVVGPSEVSQKDIFDELTSDATECINSPSVSKLDEAIKIEIQINNCVAEHTTDEGRDERNSSEKTDTIKLMESSMLNVNAPNFTPRPSSVLLALNQVTLPVSSVDAPDCGYLPDVGRALVYSKGDNSECSQLVPQQADAVSGRRKDVFVEVGSEESIDHEKDISASSSSDDDDDSTVSPSLSFLEQVSEHGSPSSEISEKSLEVVNGSKILNYTPEDLQAGSKTILKYTPEELKALNTGTSPCPIDVRVLKESSLLYVVKKTESEHDRQATDIQSLPSSMPLHRYTGRGGSPLEISTGPKSNSVKWKSLSELLPQSRFRSSQSSCESSVDLKPLTCEVSNGDLHALENESPTSLNDIAHCLLSSKDHQVPQPDRVVSDDSYIIFNASGRTLVNVADDSESTVARDRDHVKRSSTPYWPESFFLRIGPDQEDSTRFESSNPPLPSNKTEVHRGKRKKLKFRPANEVLAEKSGNNYSDCNEVPGSGVLDEASQNKFELNDVEGHVIHQPKLGAVCGSSSKRPSLFANFRQTRPKADKWVPGKQKCTRCGSTDHIIYECSQEDPLKRLSSPGYFL